MADRWGKEGVGGWESVYGQETVQGCVEESEGGCICGCQRCSGEEWRDGSGGRGRGTNTMRSERQDIPPKPVSSTQPSTAHARLLTQASRLEVHPQGGFLARYEGRVIKHPADFERTSPRRACKNR